MDGMQRKEGGWQLTGIALMTFCGAALAVALSRTIPWALLAVPGFALGLRFISMGKYRALSARIADLERRLVSPEGTSG